MTFFWREKNQPILTVFIGAPHEETLRPKNISMPNSPTNCWILPQLRSAKMWLIKNIQQYFRLNG